MQIVKLHCRPGLQFHLGNQVPFESSVLHDTESFIHSDTIYSAILNIADKIGFADEIKEAFDNNLNISSAYYMLERKNAQVYFLPRPTVPFTNTELPYKDIKKIKFVSAGVFEKAYGFDKWENNIALVTGNNWIATHEEMQKLLKQDDLVKKAKFIKLSDIVNLPQVCVHTTSQENSFYHVGNLQIADNMDINADIHVHFYFLLEGDISNSLRTVLHLLRDEGIGGQRSTGCGLPTDISITPSDIKFGGEANMSLSLVGFNNQPELDHNCYYQSLTRGGRKINANNRLKQVVMLKEGAILNSSIKGDVIDIANSKDKPYLRYGKAFLVNIPKIFLP